MYSKTHLKIIGPCSTWVQGEGWVTYVPTHLIENAGYKKINDDIVLLSKQEYNQLIECLNTLKRSKNEKN